MRAPLLYFAGLACACASPMRMTVAEPTVPGPAVSPQDDPSPLEVEPSLAGTVDYVNPGLTQLSARFARISLGDDAWDPIEDQEGFGLEFSREPATMDFGWEVGVMRYTDDERDSLGLVESELMEVYIGARRTFGHALAVWRPHFGGGASYLFADVQNQAGVDDDDSSLAAYVHGGLSAFVTRHVTLGVDLRWLFLSKLRLHGENLDADYLQLAITAGWSF
jgi:hypothetical protein